MHYNCSTYMCIIFKLACVETTMKSYNTGLMEAAKPTRANRLPGLNSLLPLLCHHQLFSLLIYIWFTEVKLKLHRAACVFLYHRILWPNKSVLMKFAFPQCSYETDQPNATAFLCSDNHFDEVCTCYKTNQHLLAALLPEFWLLLSQILIKKKIFFFHFH